MPERNCFSCHQPIQDFYIMQIGTDHWHENCMKCHICRTSLRDSCYKRDGKLLCKEDYQRLFGIKCSICNQHVPSQELVMRVLGNIYHLRCFLCSLCGHALQKGDQFIIRNGRLICSMDIERESMSYQQCMTFCPTMGLDEMNGDENILMVSHAHNASETARRGPKRPRTILTSHQRRAFKSSFEVSPKPCRKVRESLASDLGLSVRVVQVWFQNQRAKIKKLQRRQQQTEQKQLKSADTGKDATDVEDSDSPDDSDDDGESSVLDQPSDLSSVKKLKNTLDYAKSKPGSQKVNKNNLAEKFLRKEEEEERSGQDSVAALNSTHPYSLDSLTSFSLSPENSSLCDLSRESSLQHDTVSNEAKSFNMKVKFNSVSESAKRTNPIDDLFSMQASYFDV